jgi:hypothetical protein
MSPEDVMRRLTCPSCGILAHAEPDYAGVIECPRCLALQQRVRLEPLEERMLRVDPSLEEHREPV